MKKFFYLTLLLVIHAAVYAGCGNYQVFIQNNSTTTWSITNITVNHGSVEPYYLRTISSGFTSEIRAMDGVFNGPDIAVTLSNGMYIETINAQKNFCFWEAGDITASVSPGIFTRHSYDFPGSHAEGKAGQSYFEIHD